MTVSGWQTITKRRASKALQSGAGADLRPVDLERAIQRAAACSPHAPVARTGPRRRRPNHGPPPRIAHSPRPLRRQTGASTARRHRAPARRITRPASIWTPRRQVGISVPPPAHTPRHPTMSSARTFARSVPSSWSA